jgi:hypothetical protein
LNFFTFSDRLVELVPHQLQGNFISIRGDKLHPCPTERHHDVHWLALDPAFQE